MSVRDWEDQGYLDDDNDDDCCWRCHGDGGWHDCGEDTCCCLHRDGEPEDVDWYVCPECGGPAFP